MHEIKIQKNTNWVVFTQNDLKKLPTNKKPKFLIYCTKLKVLKLF